MNEIMENTEIKKLEYGFLEEAKDNRYWQIKLNKADASFGGIGAVWIKMVGGIILFSILLVPIAIISAVIARVVKNKINEEGCNQEAKTALTVYKKFMEIYPARVYSPVIKSLEIGLIANHKLRNPSLEIAVGDGYLSSIICSLQNAKLTVGSDMIFETIRSAKKYNHIEKFVLCDAEELPFFQNSFDTIIMNNLMHHLPSRKKSVAEAERVLRPRGRFIFNDNLYGWISYTFDSRISNFFRLNFLAKKLEQFKLRLFAQKMLSSQDYWNEAVKNTRMDILTNEPFVSRRAMTIGSIFEYLNLLQGQPTRESMRYLLKIKFIKRFINKNFDIIIRYLITNDEKLLKDAPGSFLFVVLSKKESGGEVTFDELKYACPKCHGELVGSEGALVCISCKTKYAIRENMPVLISYQNELNGFEDYLDSCERKAAREFIT